MAKGADGIVGKTATNILSQGSTLEKDVLNGTNWATASNELNSAKITADIPTITSVPNAQVAKNIDETMGYILNGGNIPNKIGKDWGKPFGNNEKYLPSVTEEGTAIIYQEYKVRPTSSGWQADTNLIIVGNDGTYYYTNTHLGDSIVRGETGIPFYKAGTLPDATVKKLFGE